MSHRDALTQLSDDQLVASLRDVVGTSNRLMAEMLEHLAEVERRELHVKAACSSMHVYCTQVLGFDDGAAYNRIYVARLARRFPVVLEWLAQGRIHMTGLRLLAPHFTDDGHLELLDAAAGKTKREIEKLVAKCAPKPDVPDRVRKRSTPPGATCSGTCSEGQAVDRQLAHEPVADNARSQQAHDHGANVKQVPVPAQPQPQPQQGGPSSLKPKAERDKAQPRTADRYKIEFTGSAELVDQLKRLKGLMAHREPGCGFETVVEAALKLLEAKLLKERFGVGAKPRKATTERPSNKITRHVPRDLRREVYARDGLQCAFVDAKSDRRCSETAVEFQHHRAYALGGEHSADNTSLFCSIHNQYAARQDFGEAHIQAAIERGRASREARKSREPAAPPRPRCAPTAAPARAAIGAQLRLFGG